MLDTLQAYPLSDFLADPKPHLVRLKEARATELLTVNEQPEIVLLDVESYLELVEKIEAEKEIRTIRAILRQAEGNAPQDEEPLTSEELD